MSLETMTHNAEVNRRKNCPLYGCKRVYTDTVALESHIKDHEIPAESIPGKVLLCSSIGCSDSFPDMQQLMQHLRLHHKPNIFFLCESCRAKLRSYRGLLTHLHTCSKVSRAKLKTEQMQVQAPSEAPPDYPLAVRENCNEQATPQGDAAADPMQVTPHGQHVANPLAVPPHLDQCSNPLMDSQEPLSFPQLNQEPLQLQNQDFVSSFTSLEGEKPTANLLPFDGQAEHQGHCHVQPLPQGHSQAPPQLQSAPHAPTSSAAVWKKNQGPPGNSRILWEHSRRHTCMKCSLSFPNRKALTAHIHTDHRTAQGD